MTIPVPPYNRYACVEMDRPTEQVTASGLILATVDEAKSERVHFRVVGVGPGTWAKSGERRETPQWGIGDVLVTHKTSEIQSYMWGGQRIYVILEDDVLGGYTPE